MNPDINQELKVNKNGLSRDKIDVTNFTSLITYPRSIYFHFTHNNTFLYPISLSKGKKRTMITESKLRTERIRLTRKIERRKAFPRK